MCCCLNMHISCKYNSECIFMTSRLGVFFTILSYRSKFYSIKCTVLVCGPVVVTFVWHKSFYSKRFFFVLVSPKWLFVCYKPFCSLSSSTQRLKRGKRSFTKEKKRNTKGKTVCRHHRHHHQRHCYHHSFTRLSFFDFLSECLQLYSYKFWFPPRYI